ncbi:MAG: hypothetical protein HXY30_01935 [Pseudorhodoplanes sp.]|nr:hypothetical protein [Pseudorhodoplanes sp.]
MDDEAARAEARSKAKAERERDAPLARADYEAAQTAALDNLARLRAERLARESEPARPKASKARKTGDG